MTFLSPKKPSLEKTTLSNEKTKASFTDKKAQKIFGIFDLNHGLTPLKICKFFDYSETSI